MSKLTISELYPAGYDLLQDSESFLTDLTDDELKIVGGYLTLESLGGYITLTGFLSNFSKATLFQNLLALSAMNDNTINGQTYIGQTASNVNTAGL